MLTVDNLTCSRGPRRLFTGVCFAAAPGAWIRVVGPNGSGKTTLLRALAGLTRPDAGSIEWSGVAPLSASRAWLGHAPGWKDTLTVTENLRLGWALDAEPGAVEANVVNEALRRAGLERQRNLVVARLSQGQKKRLHLARLARSTRPLWLLDEPTAALDEAGATLFCELVSGHLAKGGIAVIATHLPLAIMAGCAHDVVIAA